MRIIDWVKGMRIWQAVGMCRPNISTLRDEASAKIEWKRTWFKAFVRRAQATRVVTCDVSLVDQARLEFERLTEQVQMAQTKSQLDALVYEAEAVSRLGAYVCPEQEIPFLGNDNISTLEEWGVPAAVILRFRNNLLPELEITQPNSAATARAALNVIFEKYDSWAEYIDDYNNEMQLAAFRLLLGIVGSTLLSAVLLWLGCLFWGLFTAGGAGACLSVISKLPTLSTWGEHAVYRRKLRSRLATGLAASVIGAGFLFSGVVSLGLGEVKLTLIAVACTHSPPRVAVFLPPVPESEKETVSPGQPPVDSNSDYCTAPRVLLLVAIAMLLGFSERALVSFEDRLFGGKGS